MMNRLLLDMRKLFYFFFCEKIKPKIITASLGLVLLLLVLLSCEASPNSPTSEGVNTKLQPPYLAFSSPTLDFENYNLGDFAWVTFTITNTGEEASPDFQIRFFTSLDQERDDTDTLVASTHVASIPANSYVVVSNDVQLKYSTNITALDWFLELYLGYYVKTLTDPIVESDGLGYILFSFPSFETKKLLTLQNSESIDSFLFLDSVAFANIDPLGAFKEEIVYTYSGNGSTDAGLYYALIQNVNFTQIQETKIEEDAYGMPAIADWDTNGNDLLEMGISEGDNNRYHYYYHDGVGINSSGTKFFTTNTIFNLATDTDNDGDIDLVILTGEDGENTLYHYENTAGNGNPSFTKHEVDDMSGIFADMVGGDFDGDGDIDLLVSDIQSGFLYHYRGNSTDDVGFETNSTSVISEALSGASDMEVVDLDNDGDLDVLIGIESVSTTASFSTISGVYWLENQGSGFHGVTTPQQLFASKRGIHSLKTGDLTGDGRIDIVVTQYDDDAIYWYENLATDYGDSGDSGDNRQVGEFFERPVALRISGPYAIDLGDVDEDGDLDIVSIARNEESIYLHLNELYTRYTKRID